jgi:hypothetical protein
MAGGEMQTRRAFLDGTETRHRQMMAGVDGQDDETPNPPKSHTKKPPVGAAPAKVSLALVIFLCGLWAAGVLQG